MTQRMKVEKDFRVRFILGREPVIMVETVRAVSMADAIAFVALQNDGFRLVSCTEDR
jgi:hypothetical protein